MHRIDIIVETPKGSNEKYNFDPEKQCFRFKKALPLGMVFPYDFGFIPNTLGDDGDPLDAMLISEFRFFPGCMVSCRLVGALLAEQTEKKTIRNDRFFFIPELSVQYKHIVSISTLPREELSQLKQFFINYNAIEGKTFRPLQMINAGKAFQLLQKQLKESEVSKVGNSGRNKRYFF
jgi:inorganic pyrophosphatase